MAASLNRRRLISFAFFGLFTVAFLAVTAAAVTLQRQRSETPAALLHIARDRDDYQAYRTFRDIQAVRIKSYLVLRSVLEIKEVAALESIKEQEDAVAWLRDRLQIDFPGDGELLRISLKGGDRKETAKLVNAIARTYLKEFDNEQRGGIQSRLHQLKEFFSKYENQLRDIRESKRKLSLALRSGNPEAIGIEQRLAKQDLLATAKELRSTKMQLLKLESQLKVKQKHNDKEEGTSLQERIAVLREIEKSLNEGKDRLIQQCRRENVKPADVVAFELEIAMVQSVLKKGPDQCAALEMELIRPSRIQLLEEARE